MKRLLLSITAMTTFSAQRMLVLYYSETGTTKTVAQELQKQTGADIESIECVEPYSGNFQETIQRGQLEMQSGNYPALKALKKKVADYDIVFLGYPFGLVPTPTPLLHCSRSRTLLARRLFPSVLSAVVDLTHRATHSARHYQRHRC